MYCSKNKQDENLRKKEHHLHGFTDRNGGGWLRSEHGEKRELCETERIKQGSREGRTRGSRERNRASMET